MVSTTLWESNRLTAIKTVSMYLRAAKTEAEDAGESTDGMASSVSELRNQLLSLTGGKVDIQIDANTFKSTYDILQDLSEVWDELTDVSRANILEMIGGKRNSNVVSALLSNFETAKDVMSELGGAAGSALAENEEYLDSISGHITQFKVALEELALAAIDNEFVKDIIDAGKLIINILTSVMNLLDKIGGLRTVASVALPLAAFNNINDIITKIKEKSGVFESLTKGVSLFGKEFTKLRNTGVSSISAVGGAFKSAIGLISKAQIAVAAISLVLAVIIPLIQKIHKSTDELIQEYKDVAAEVESLNDELETTQDRIEKLEKLKKNGALSLIEQDELEYLEKYNDQLERQIRNEEHLAQIAAQEQNEALVNDWNKEKFALSDDTSAYLSDVYYDKATKIYEENQRLIDLFNIGDNNAIINEYGEDALAYASEVAIEYKRLLDMGFAYADQGAKTQFATSQEYFAFLNDEYQRLYANLGNLSENEYGALEAIKLELLSLQSLVGNSYLTPYVGTDVNTDEWNTLSVAIDKCLHPAEYLMSVLDKLPDKVKSALSVAYESGDMTVGSLMALAEKYPELQSAMDEMLESGYTAEQIAEHFNSLAGAIGDFSSITLSVEIEGMSEASEKLDKLQSIKESLSGAASLDDNVFNEIAELLPEAASGITDLESAISAVDAALASTEQDVKYHFGRILMTNLSTVEGIINNNAGLQSLLASMYGDDVENWRDAATGKWRADATLVSKLTDLWSEYHGRNIDEMKAQVAAFESVFGADGKGYESFGSSLGVRFFDEMNMIGYESYQMMKGYLELYDKFTSGLGSGDDGDDKITDTTVEIEKYRKELKALSDIDLRQEKLDLQLSNTDDPMEQIKLHRQLIDTYKDEQDALHDLNESRRSDIQSGIDELESWGFIIDYDPAANDLFIQNMEEINSLVNGKNDEETKTLRDRIKELMDSIIELNEENQESSATWWELKYDIESAGVSIVDAMKEIISISSEAVDSIQNVYDTLHAAADEYAANDGFITVDTFQSIVDLGPQYLQFLQNENGMLQITEERINDLIAAKTRQLAIDTALSYVLQLQEALKKGNIEDLNNLLYATQSATNATWALVEAQLNTLDLTPEQRAAAVQYMQNLQDLAENAAEGIEYTTESMQSAKTAADDILNYVMDMLKDLNQQQIDAIEDQKDAFSEYIDLQKEALENEKENADYKKNVSAKLKEIAKIQAQLDALSLDNSREAQAKRAKLQEELAKLQEELGETQAERSVEMQTEALDKMQKAYEEQKDGEIKELEDSLSSQQKLYDAAIEYMETNWDSLYDQLIAWNTEYGSVLNSEITSAWDAVIAKVKEYKGYLDLIDHPDAIGDYGGSSSDGSDGTVGDSSAYANSSSSQLTKDPSSMSLEEIVNEMFRNSNAWHGKDASVQKSLAQRNFELGTALSRYGITAVRGGDGHWYVDREGGKRLFDEYKQYCYHGGGIAGDIGTLKENELLAKLEEGEAIVSNQNKNTLFKLIEFVDALSHKLNISGMNSFGRIPTVQQAPDFSHLKPNQTVTVHMGDVIIQGNADKSTIEQHARINRETVNEIARIIGVKH